MSTALDALAIQRLDAMFGKNFCRDLVEVNEVTASVKVELGGNLKVGDILLTFNGQPIAADHEKLAKTIQTLCKSNPVLKVSLRFLRLKYRISRPPSFPSYQKQPGYIYETAVLYSLKNVIRFGLDIREIDNKLVVCDIAENSLAEITFHLGEAIIDIDGEKMTNCQMFAERVKKSLEIRSFALVLLEIPNTDVIKNMIRNKISNATKDVIRVVSIPVDAKKYASEGIAILKKATEPKPVFIEEKSKMNQVQHLKLEEKVREMDVPTCWNSALFVKLPPQKTVESEAI